MFNIDPDAWVYGAQKIGELANIRDDNGAVDIAKVLYGLRQGYLNAEKYGRIWRSTPRLLRSQSPAQQEAASSPSG